MRKILILGHSHVLALKRALADRADLYPDDQIEVLRVGGTKAAKSKDSSDIDFEAALEKIKALGPDDLLVTLLRGSQYAQIGLIQHPIPYDVFVPDAQGIDPERQVVPHAVMAAAFAEILDRITSKILKPMVKASKAPVLCLESPSPKEAEAPSLYGAQRQAELRGQEWDETAVKISPAPLRLRLWQIQNSVQQDYCAENSLFYLTCPPETLDEAGYLKPEFYWVDSTHANEAYGGLMLDRIVAWRP